MRATSRVLIGIVLALLALGIVMLASTSSVRGEVAFDDPLYFLKRQLVWLALALLAWRATTFIDYHVWERLAPPIAVGALFMLCLVFVPGIGAQINGSYRWIRIGPLSLQPSEFGKLALVMGMAAWMAHVGRRARLLRQGLLYPVAGLAVLAGLLILEPDFGTTMLVGAVGLLIMYAGGTRLSYLMVTSAAGAGAFAVAILHNRVRLERILAFLFPDKHPETAYHLAQSKVAFMRGGLWGVGLGNGLQKKFYLPEAHTDFIFAIIGEELGLMVTLAVVLLFAGILACGMRISFKAPDAFGRLLAFGFTMLISLQVVINLGVVTGSLPTKGLPLPFISYGGSSLLVCVASIGVLLNIADHCEKAHKDRHTRPIKDRAHRL